MVARVKFLYKITTFFDIGNILAHAGATFAAQTQPSLIVASSMGALALLVPERLYPQPVTKCITRPKISIVSPPQPSKLSPN